MDNSILKNPTRTTTEDPNNVLKIENVGKLAYFFSLKHTFNESKKSYTINYCTSFYIDNTLLIESLKTKSIYITALIFMDKFIAEQPEFINCVNLTDDHLLQIFTYFFNTIKA